jgi:hypothetical protein
VIAPPLPSGLARRRLAELILAALHEPAARTRLEALGQDARSAADWVGACEARQVQAVLDRARRASGAVAAVPVRGPVRALAAALEAAAVLFDAGLFFEVHEILEPHWAAAAGGTRQILQGLIQIAVGYQHGANGNGAGARSLLGEGALRVRGGRLLGVDLDDFASRVAAARDRLSTISGADLIVPAFPRGWRDSP